MQFGHIFHPKIAGMAAAQPVRPQGRIARSPGRAAIPRGYMVRPRGRMAMRARRRRGSVLVVALTLLVVLTTIALSLTGVTLHDQVYAQDDIQREQALQAADAGIDCYLGWLNNQLNHSALQVDPNGAPPAGKTISATLDDGAAFTVTELSRSVSFGKGVITVQSVGSYTPTGAAKPTYKMTATCDVSYYDENITPYANALFCGYAWDENIVYAPLNIHGPVNIQGLGYPFQDLNGNGVWNAGEPFIDIVDTWYWNGQFQYGKGPSDTAFSFSSGGIYNNYVSGSSFTGTVGTALQNILNNQLPPLPQTTIDGQLVNTLHSSLRVLHGQVTLSNTATAGTSQATAPAGNAGPLDSVDISDGLPNNTLSHIFSQTPLGQYDLPTSVVGMPDLFNFVDSSGNMIPRTNSQPVGTTDSQGDIQWQQAFLNAGNVYNFTGDGKSPADALYLNSSTAGADRAHAYTVGNPATNGLLFYKDPSGAPHSYVLEINGTVRVAGDSNFLKTGSPDVSYNGRIILGDPGGTVTYKGNGTLMTGFQYVAEPKPPPGGKSNTAYHNWPRGRMYVHGNLVPQGNYATGGGFPNNVLGLVTDDEMEIDTDTGTSPPTTGTADSQGNVVAIFYANGGMLIGHGSNVIGSLICSTVEQADNTPSIYWVPALQSSKLPAGLPGSAPIWWAIHAAVQDYAFKQS